MNDLEALKGQIKARMSGKISPYCSVNQDVNTNGLKFVIEQAVQESLTNLTRQIVDAVVDELYSDEKFEIDIGLRDGDIRVGQ